MWPERFSMWEDDMLHIVAYNLWKNSWLQCILLLLKNPHTFHHDIGNENFQENFDKSHSMSILLGARTRQCLG